MEKMQPKVVEGRECPICHSPLVYRKGKYGEFIGCSNYPKCTYIDKQKEAIQKQGKKEEALMQQALQERVAQDDKTNRALSQKAEHQQAGEAIQKDALQSASDSESQKAVLDILTKPRDKEEQGGK